MLVVKEKDGEFLVLGKCYTYEYPEAAKFRTVHEALEALYKSGNVGTWEVIRHYGTTREEVATTKRIVGFQGE